VISNYKDPSKSDVVGLLRRAADAADHLRLWTDPDTGEVVDREVVIDAISAKTEESSRGPIHAITVWYRYVDETDADGTPGAVPGDRRRHADVTVTRVPSVTDLKRLHAAVDLVQHDIYRALGPGAVSVVFADDGPTALADQESALGVTGSHERPEAWAFVSPGEGAIGLRAASPDGWSSFLCSVAEALQEVVMESMRFRGAAVPPCPEHPNTPLWPAVIGDEAVWRCTDGAAVRILIGAFGDD
jgi:hypothetical protein